MQRTDVVFSSGGVECAAWLYRPDGEGPHPVVVMAHGFSATLRDQLGALVGRPPRYVPAVGPPGTFAMMTSPDAEPGFAALTPAQTGWVNRVSARVALRVGLYRPGRVVSDIDCPVLFCVSDRDAVTPARATLKHAGRARRGEVKRYPVGHFEIYVGEPFEHAVADQVEFLRRTLDVSAPTAAA